MISISNDLITNWGGQLPGFGQIFTQMCIVLQDLCLTKLCNK